MKYFNTLFILLFFLLFSMPFLAAQERHDPKALTGGVLVGVNASTLNNSDYHYLYKPKLGGFMLYHFAKIPFALYSELAFDRQGFRQSFEGGEKIDLDYLTFSVVPAFKYNRLMVGAGLYGGLLTQKDSDQPPSRFLEQRKVENKDVGFRTDAQVRITDWASLAFSYRLGFISAYNYRRDASISPFPVRYGRVDHKTQVFSLVALLTI
ncbi:MAG: outer membrane beta-barrel protein [Saprospiraceae bacterium]